MPKSKSDQRTCLAYYIETGLQIMEIHRGLVAVEDRGAYFMEQENGPCRVSVLSIALIGKLRNVDEAIIKYRERSRGDLPAEHVFSVLLDLYFDTRLLRGVDDAHGQLGMSAQEIAVALRANNLDL